MELYRYTAEMANNAETISHFTQGIDDEQARWKPDFDSWSMLEVISHLLDEEREDFRVRLDYILHRPGEDAPPIDPGGWVTSRGYNQRDFRQTVSQFRQARAESIAWLKGLTHIDWEAGYQMPFGVVKAGDMFAAWVAHDLLHMRQLVELLWAYTNQQVAPYSTRYAGEW